MNEKVLAFIKKKDEIIKEERNKFLIDLGLVQKIYSPDNSSTYEYSKYEYINGEKRYYKEIALDVTEEEYTEIVKRENVIKEIEKKETEKHQQENKHHFFKALVPLFELPKDSYSETSKNDNGKCALSFTFQILAWIIWLLEIIFGIVLGLNEISLMFVVWISAFLSGIFLYGFAQILNYLAIITAILQHGYKYNDKMRK